MIEQPKLEDKEEIYNLICILKNKSINKDGREFILDNKVLHNVCRYYSEKIKYG